MKNEKNFILSLKFPFSLVKENRFIMLKIVDDSAKKGADSEADNDARVDEKTDKDPESTEDKKTRENVEKSEKVEQEMEAVDKSLMDKEGELETAYEDFRQKTEDFKKKPEPVSDADKQAYAQEKAVYDAKVASLRSEIMALQKKKVDLALESRALAAYKDPRVEAFVKEKDMEKLEAELEAGKKKFFDGLIGSLDSAKIAERRQEFQINADTWSITSASGLNALKKDWTNLKIYEDSPFFNNIFDQLARLSDPNELNTLKPGEKEIYSSIEEKKKVYLAPEANVRKIGDKALASAVSFFVAIKTLLKTQDNFQTAANERNQGKDQDKIAATGIKFVTDNVRKFQDAIKQKDWGTALVYVVAGYVAYKGAMKLWENTPDLAKKGIYAAGFLYAVNMFAKNAGYDALKALGITAKEDEVRGTSLANFYNLDKVPEGKDLDGRVLLDIGGVSVADLNGLYFEPHGGDIKAIDPNQLPGHFPQFRGLSASVLSKDGPLTSKEEEYRRVGREIYKIAKVVRLSYDKYIKPKNGLIIEEALSKDPDFKNVTVMSYAMIFNGIAQSGRERLSGGILDSLGLSVASFRMKRRFDAVFKDKQMDFEAENKPISAGVYSAQVMNFPVVIREDGVNKKYVVFSRDDYNRAGGNPDAVTQALCEIPFDGNADEQVEKLKDSVIGRFTKVVEELNKSAKDSLDLGEVKYVSGKFVSRLTVKAGSMLGKEETMDVFLKVSKDGSTVEVYRMTDGELIINLDSTGDRSKLLGNLVMAGLCRQDNMKPFFFLYKAKKLEFKGQNMDADGSFDVLAGDSKVLIKFKLDKETGRYVFADASAEAKLFDVNNYGFLRELAENAVRENKDWKRETERFKNVLESVPEEYLVNLFKNAPKWWTEATSYKWFRGFGLDQMTGSIPKNYTNAMVDAQAEFLISRKVSDIVNKGGGTLAGASAEVSNSDDIKAAADKLEKLTTGLSNNKEQKEREGKAYASEDFRTDVLDKVSKLAIKSNTYALWYEQFSTYIHMKHGKDGLISGRTERAAKILSVYAAYTYKMDLKSLDGSRVDSANYKKHATYANYVAERMFMKLNEWNGKSPIVGSLPENIPDRGPDWEIDEWSVFYNAWTIRAKRKDEKQSDYNKYVARKIKERKKYESIGVTVKDPEGNDEHGEILAEQESLKMSKDYVTFDAWLEDPSSPLPVSMLFKTRDKPFEFIVNAGNKTKLEKFKRLLGDGKTVETMVLPDTFKFFHSRMQKSLRQLRDGGYGETTNRFDELMNTNYNVNYSVKVEDFGKYSKKITVEVNKNKQSVLYEEVEKLEAKMASAGRALTKSEQVKMINERIAEIVEETILNENVIDLYFKKGTLTDNCMNLYRKFKHWLF